MSLLIVELQFLYCRLPSSRNSITEICVEELNYIKGDVKVRNEVRGDYAEN